MLLEVVMKITESGEMYLEYILTLSKKLSRVRSIDIVNFSGYSKPSISRALKLLKDEGYIKVLEGGFIELTEEGRYCAEKIYDRHRILTEVLIKIGVSEDTATKDACKIEHYLSDETMEKIKELAKK